MATFDPGNHPRMVAANLAVSAAKVEHQRLKNAALLSADPIGFSAPSNGLAALWHAESKRNAVYRELKADWLAHREADAAVQIAPNATFDSLPVSVAEAAAHRSLAA